jgi:hypothetical protein
MRGTSLSLNWVFVLLASAVLLCILCLVLALVLVQRRIFGIDDLWDDEYDDV